VVLRRRLNLQNRVLKSNVAIEMLQPDHREITLFFLGCQTSFAFIVFARDSIYAKRAYAIAIPSVCPSVCPSVTRVDQSKTVEVRIMQFSPHSSPIPLVFAR